MGVIPNEVRVSPVLKEDMLAPLDVITKFLISFHVFSSLRNAVYLEENHTNMPQHECHTERSERISGFKRRHARSAQCDRGA